MRNVKRQRPRKLAPKKKTVRSWCIGVGTKLEALTRRAKQHIDVRDLRIREESDAVEKLQKRWKVRCPVCGRRLHPKKVLFGSEREFHAFVIPQHKAT